MDSPKQMDAGTAQAGQEAETHQPEQTQVQQSNTKTNNQADEADRTSTQMQATLFTDWAAI